MQYLAIILGFFGLFAFFEISSLKRRISALEEQLTNVKGTPSFENRRILIQAAKSYIGKKVTLEFKDDCEDADVLMYGNTKHGSNTILDADDNWILIRIESKKGIVEKLIRMQSIQRISVLDS